MRKVEIVKRLLTNDFEFHLFKASLGNLGEKGNKLRFNNFAYGIREMSRHFLHNLAPEEQVRNSQWFKPEDEDNKVTSHQLIKYAIQGGIPDEFLGKWGFNTKDIEETIKSVKETLTSLSKHSHINPRVFDIDDDEIERVSQEVVDCFIEFVEAIEACRVKLKRFLDLHVEQHLDSSIVSNSFNNVALLVPHYSLYFAEVSGYRVSEINDQEIIVAVSGHLHVKLDSGSKQEGPEGDGQDVDRNFPFETKIRYRIGDEFL